MYISCIPKSAVCIMCILGLTYAFCTHPNFNMKSTSIVLNLKYKFLEYSMGENKKKILFYFCYACKNAVAPFCCCSLEKKIPIFTKCISFTNLYHIFSATEINTA